MKHGLTAYIRHGCRCEVCRAADRARFQRQREKVIAAGIPHGTVRGYTAGGCRCDKCREAKRTARADRAKWERTEASQVHGDYERGWRRGCRCVRCAAVARDRVRRYRATKGEQ